MAGKVMAVDSYTRYPYNDIAAVAAMREHGNEFLQLSPEFIAAGNEAATMWADEQAAENEWFKKAYDHRRAIPGAQSRRTGRASSCSRSERTESGPRRRARN